MQRLTAIVIAIVVVAIAACAGVAALVMFRLPPAEAGLIALTVMTVLVLYNTTTARLRDRSEIGGQIADLSRGSADLARQVAEIGRRVSAFEAQDARRGRLGDTLAGEVGELSVIVKDLADTVAGHEARLRGVAKAAPARLSGAAERAAPSEPLEASPPEPATSSLQCKSADEVVAIVKAAIEGGRVDLYLQPVVTLPQRKIRFYEAMTRLRSEDGSVILPNEFLAHAEAAGLIATIDNMQLFRCVQVLRRLMLKNREIGLFCNISVATLKDPVIVRQVLDFMDANRALCGALMLEFSQAAFRGLGPMEKESLGALTGMGYGFSMDRVSDLRFGPGELSDLGIRFVKVPAAMLFDRTGAAAEINAADLSERLGRNGISLIADCIETEPVVVDLLDYDVRYGQGFLFSAPRPVRADALQGAVRSTGADHRPETGSARAAI